MMVPWQMMDKVLAATTTMNILDPRTLTKYTDPLPIPGVMPQIGMNAYNVGMFQKMQQLHSQLGPTTVWAYGTTSKQAGYPAATFETVQGTPITVKWRTSIKTHLLPVDPTIHWANPNNMPTPTPPFNPWPPGYAEAQSPVPVVAHRHGGEQASAFDGGPDSWFTYNGIKGPGYVTDTYTFPNAQEPATLWYHDHALGITRLNVYMGLAGFYLLRGTPGSAWAQIEAQLPSGAYEIPIVIQDRMFYTDGSFYFPVMPPNPDIHPYWTPEFFGDTIVVNGKVWPYLNVEPRKYRFRLLNGSNARFYNLTFGGAPVTQIGTDGGYLNSPVPVSSVFMAPGERADVIVDFTGMAPGATITVRNDAKAPYPSGTPADPQTVGQIMEFRVVPLTAPDTSVIPSTLRPWPIQDLSKEPIAVKRQLTLNEVVSKSGPIELLLNNTPWHMPTTEMQKNGTTELWEIINMTMDTHPIHLHLVQFQLLNRQPYNQTQYMAAYMAAYGGMLPPYPPGPMGPPYDYYMPNADGALGGNPAVSPFLQDKATPAPPEEAGWKDTFKMNPGEVTRILIRTAKQDGTPYPFDPTTGPGYVWHCHIIDHEDNEMMRRYQVAP